MTHSLRVHFQLGCWFVQTEDAPDVWRSIEGPYLFRADALDALRRIEGRRAA